MAFSFAIPTKCESLGCHLGYTATIIGQPIYLCGQEQRYIILCIEITYMDFHEFILSDSYGN